MATSDPTRRTILGTLAVLPVALGCSKAQSSDAGTGVRLSLAAFGGTPNVADNAPALRAAIAALSSRGGGVLDIGAGTYRIVAASVGQGGIALPSAITIRGAGKSDTVLRVTGDAVCNLFVALNRSDIALEDLTLVGNNAAYEPGYGSGAAIRWALDETAVASVSGFAMRRVHLENFRGNFWVDIENDAQAARQLEMRAIVLDAVTFTSRPGNSIKPGSVTHNCSAVCITGYSGIVRTVRITGLSGDARHIKTGIILYHKVIDAQLNDVVIAAAGVEGATDDAGAYAIQIYDPDGIMSSITVTRPVITTPRSVGIYVAGGQNVSIRAPRISGQTDQRAETLPKGAIVFNGTRDWEVIGGQLRDNWRDIGISPPAFGTQTKPTPVHGRVEGVSADGSQDGIAISYFAGAVGTDIVFRNCQWRTHGRTVSVQNSDAAIVPGSSPAGGYLNGIVFENCQFEAGPGFRAIDLWNGSGSPAGGYVISRCRLVGSNPVYARDQTGSLRIEDCEIRDLGTDAGASAATLLGCPRLELRDCTLHAPGRDGIGINLAGSAGAVRGLRFVDCTSNLPPLPSPQLGRGRPQFTGRKGQYVQNLAPTSGAATGWLSEGGSVWREAPAP